MIYKYKGYLTTYFETGMEGISVILQDFRGAYRENNWDLSWAYFFSRRESILAKIYDNDKNLVYEGELNFNMKYKDDMHFLVPDEIDTEDWQKWISNYYIIEIETERSIMNTTFNAKQALYRVLYFNEDEVVEIFKGYLYYGGLQLNSIIQLRQKEKGKEFYTKFFKLKGKAHIIQEKEKYYSVYTDENEYYELHLEEE